MKKISAILLSLIVASNCSFAADTHTQNKHSHIIGTCGFIDTVNFTWPAGSQILSMSTSGGLAIQKVTPTQIYVEDNGSCAAGVVSVQVGKSASDSSSIQMTDGPWTYLNSTQIKSTGGYKFSGQNATGPDVYALTFSQK